MRLTAGAIPIQIPCSKRVKWGNAMQLKSGRLALLAVSLLTAGISTASSAPATVSGPAALALAGVVALYSPLLTADEREEYETLVRLGNFIGILQGRARRRLDAGQAA